MFRYTASDVCAVVVTYFPRPGCADNLSALLPQVGKLLVVDNGSDEKSFQPVAAAAERLGAGIIRLGSNTGIATALNVGLRFARDQGYQWYATFDQDSTPPPDMIQTMLRARGAYPRPAEVALISPCHVDPRLGLVTAYPWTEESGEGWRVTTSALASGNLVSVEAAARVGGFDETLFIDWVDIEFCLRLRRLDYRILQAMHAKLSHSLGELDVRRFIAKPVVITNHAAVRRYYMTRNRIITWGRYWRREPLYVLWDIYFFLRDTLYMVLFEQNVMRKAAMTARGMRDALMNIRGPFPGST
jgi:rhamnosyltransferase